MNFSNIKVGDQFKNYKEFCAALDVKPGTGTQKMAQLKQIDQHLKYERKGQSYLILDIYNAPLLYSSTQPIIPSSNSLNKTYCPYIQLLLVQYLANQCSGTVEENVTITTLFATELYKIVGLVNENFGDSRHEEYYIKQHNSTSTDTRKELNTVLREAHTKLNSMITYALLSLKKRYILRTAEVYELVGNDHQSRISTPEETTRIDAYYYETLHEFNCKYLWQIYSTHQQHKFYSSINKKVAADKKLHASKAISKIEFSFMRKILIDTIPQLELELQKIYLNNEFINFMLNKMERTHKSFNLIYPPLSVGKESSISSHPRNDPKNYMYTLPLNQCMTDFKDILNEFVQYKPKINH